MNIRNKFLIPTILLIVFGMGVSTTISFVKSKSTLSNALLENIDQRTESVAVSLHTWLEDLQLDLRSWSHEDVYAKATKTSIIGKAARVTANNKMIQLKKDYSYYEDIFLSDSTGLVIAASREAVIDKVKVGDRDYFKAAMAGKAFISDAEVSRGSGNPVFFIAAPIVEKDQVVGVITGVVAISSFSELFIQPIKVGEQGYAYVMNEKGDVLAHPDPAKIMKTNFAQYDWAKQMIAMEKGHIKYAYEGIEKTVAFYNVEGQDWIVAITLPHDEILKPSRHLGAINLGVSIAVAVVAVILIYFVTSTIVNPLNQVVAGLQDAAEGNGDLTKRIEISSKDEVGELAKWFNTFVEKMQHIIAQVSDKAGGLDQSSKELTEIASMLANSANQTSGKALTVSSSSEEMSTGISSAAKTMEEASSNLSIIASGAEEMTATISEIAGNTEKGRQISEDAVEQTTNATTQIQELGAAAIQIGKVVETITEISEQVNLLALNATIEAARAGEAGKGFAVVANEIKELAKQTAEASGEIKNQIEGIQGSTQNTVSEIHNIADVVGQLNELVSTIAAAVEEQSVTTQDIAGNVANASEGVSEVNNTISETAEAANIITAEIADVTSASAEMSDSSSQVNTSSNELQGFARELNALVSQFKV